MLAFKEWVVNTVINDTILQGYLRDTNGNMNVFPVDVDINPENFPCLIYQDAGVSVLSRPQGMHVGTFQIDIYSLDNALETENIYTRLAQLFNFKDSTNETIGGILWWIRENNVRDTHETVNSRRIWRKICTYKFWFSNTDGS